MSELNKEIFASPEAFHAELSKLEGATSAQTPSENNKDFNGIKQNIEAPIQSLAKADQPIEDISTVDNEPENPSETQEQAVGHQDDQQAVHDEVESIDKKASHMIPKSRLDKELENRRTLEKQLQEEKDRNIRYETQLQMIAAMRQEPEAPKEEYVDPIDPETFNYTNKKLAAIEDKFQKAFSALEQKTTEMNQINLINAQETHFERQNPDYRKAVEYVKNIESAIAKNLTSDDSLANQIVNSKFQAAIQMALSNNQNAAEVIYNMAKTYGYSAEAPKAAPASVDGKANLEALNKNMGRTANLNHLGNRANPTLIPTDIKAAFKKQGDERSGIDPKVFHEILKKHESIANQY